MVPVITVELGQPVTFSCVLLSGFSKRQIFWYKQRAGDSLKLISEQRTGANLVHGPEFPASRFEVKDDENTNNLTILSTIHEDEGMYHCATLDWSENTWTGTYLSVKGNNIFNPVVVIMNNNLTWCHQVFQIH